MGRCVHCCGCREMARQMPLEPGPPRLRLPLVWVALAAHMDLWALKLDRQVIHEKTVAAVCLKGNPLGMFFFEKL